MRVQQLEQFYRDGVNRLKEQMKKQEKERLEQMRCQIRKEQQALCEERIRKEREARSKELRLVQEELIRITEQSAALKERMDKMIAQKGME